MIEPNLRDEAANWLLMHQLDDMTPANTAAFEYWIAATPGALRAYRHAERAWRIAGEPGVNTEVDTPRSLYLAQYRTKRHVGRWVIGAIAASFALALLAAPSQLSRFVDVQIAQLRGEGEVLNTGNNRRSRTILADGTVVTMDADTRVRILEMGDRRRVELLSGHAFFKVAKDPLHPFLVTAMNKTVRALGTQFDVRIEPDAVAVTLVEGRVRVDEPRGLLQPPISTEMTPGKRLIAANDQVWMMTPIDALAATAWLKGQLFYDDETVEQIVADVNEGSNRKIVFVGPVDEHQRLAGAIGQGDVDTLATVLEVKGIAHVVARQNDRIEMQQDTPDRSRINLSMP